MCTHTFLNIHLINYKALFEGCAIWLQLDIHHMLCVSQVSGSFTDITLDGACGVTKGCLYFPSFCGGNNCNYIVTYSMDRIADEVTFEIKAKSSGYVTMALSADDKMVCIIVQYSRRSCEMLLLDY